ncbi:hypothetical protein ES703_107731 [subsurface metagenome]
MFLMLYFMVDWVNPWMVRHMDQLIIWVDGGIWNNSVWDSDEDGVLFVDEDDVSERVLVV